MSKSKEPSYIPHFTVTDEITYSTDKGAFHCC